MVWRIRKDRRGITWEESGRTRDGLGLLLDLGLERKGRRKWEISKGLSFMHGIKWIIIYTSSEIFNVEEEGFIF